MKYDRPWVLQANDPAWHRLRPNHTLRLALAQKDVVEFPVIVIALPEELTKFNFLGQSNGVQQGAAADRGNGQLQVQAQQLERSA